jgi:hypothetical protein
MDLDQPGSLAIPCLDANGDHDLSEDGFPWLWLQAAAGLPAKSLHVGLISWYAAGRLGSSSVFLSNTLCMLFGLDPMRSTADCDLCRMPAWWLLNASEVNPRW